MSVTEKDKNMLAEIMNQPNAWADAIGLVESRADRLVELVADVDEVIFTGCGSGLNASTILAATFQHCTGTRTQAVSAAEVIFFPETVFVESTRYLMVLISRSGATTETVMAGDLAASRNIPTVALTCYADSPLARNSTEALVLESVHETSIPSTQSVTSMILCGQTLCSLVSGKTDYLAQLKRLPDLGRTVIDEYHDLSRTIGENKDIQKFAFVGSGSLRGIAMECQLKVKETAILPADAYPLLEYRHGPKSNVDKHTLITMLSSDRMGEAEETFINEMKELKGWVFAVCDQAGSTIMSQADYVAEVNSGLPDFARDILYLPPVHFMAYYKALAEGRSPANPANLTYWIETPGL